MKALVVVFAAAACHASTSTSTSTSPSPSPTPPPVPMSDPSEYAIDRVSRDAGEAIFARTGVGDPYRTGVPYPIFVALLRGYPQQFGATTGELAARFGFVARTAEPASDDLDVREGLPVGMHLTIDPLTGVPFVVTNCALCHAAKVDDKLVVGLANRRVRVHAYDAAFADVAAKLSHERLRRLADAAEDERHVAWPEPYRDAIVAATIEALRVRARDRAWLVERTRDGPPGRVATIETFAPVLAQLTGRSIDHATDIGWAKVPDVIGFAHRTSLTWDGSGEGAMDLLVVEADVAAGVRVAWLERHPFQGPSLAAYLRQPAPRPRFPGAVDREHARRGKQLFDDHCARCHGSYADDGRVLSYDEPIVALDDVGTDPARSLAATASFERAANDPDLTRGYTRFRRTAGYIPPVLTNVWARAPYGHAGQWPSLDMLATPPDARPRRFVVRYDAPYDLRAVGLAIRTGDAPLEHGDYAVDATKPGFSVAGHPFLAELSLDEREAVVEYLKTL